MNPPAGHHPLAYKDEAFLDSEGTLFVAEMIRADQVNRGKP